MKTYEVLELKEQFPAREAGRIKTVFREIDALLEAMWQRSDERVGLQRGRRYYNYQRSLFIRAHREAIESVAYSK